MASDIQQCYNDYEKEVDELEELSTALINSLSRTDTEEAFSPMDRTKMIADCESKAASIRDKKKNFSLELRLVKDRKEKSTMTEQAKQLDQRFNKYVENVKAAKVQIGKKELLAGASTQMAPGTKGPNPYSTEGKSNDELLAGANLLQDKSMESLSRTAAMIEASKEVGAATIEELRRQRDQMTKIEEEVDTIATNLQRAERLILNFSRRMMTDKLIQGFTALNIVVLLGLIIYVAVTKKSLTPSTGR